MSNPLQVGRTVLRAALWLAVLAATTGCASWRAAHQAQEAERREMWDNAVLSYARAVSLSPGDIGYKVALARVKLRAGAQHFDRGKRYLANGQIELAVPELQEATILDPGNQYATQELQKAMDELERRRRGPSDYEKARAEAAKKSADLGPPKLDPTANTPLHLKFPDTTLSEMYDTLSKMSGINFLYDDKLDLKKKTSIELANATFEKAMDILMLMNKHAYKVIDGHTILIFDDNQQKHREYDDNVIRTFYLSNAETKEVQTLLRTLLESRRLAENANLNAITIKDTPEKIKVAERIIKANDKAKGEVLVDIELLELNRSRTTNLGLDLSSKSLSLVFGDGKQSLPLNNLARIKADAAWSVGTIPSVVMNFLKSDSDSKSIAKPQLRILEGDNGKITIGDRVPIPATSFNTGSTIGGNIVPITSFTYQNVGIIVDIKPRVHHNKEVTLEMKLEVSSLAGSVQGTGGVSQPIIGTRSVETTIRLLDGETNLLAGLIKEDESKSLAGVPGISQIPLLKRLFGNTNTDGKSTDIVLAITPHIIRVPNIEPIDLVPLWVGSEEQIELRGVARNALGESPFAGPSPWEQIEKELGGDEANAPAKPAAPAAPGKDAAAKPDARPVRESAKQAEPPADTRPPRPPPAPPKPAETPKKPDAKPAEPAKPAETAKPAEPAKPDTAKGAAAAPPAGTPLPKQGTFTAAKGANAPPAAGAQPAPEEGSEEPSEEAADAGGDEVAPDDESDDTAADDKKPIVPAQLRLAPDRPVVAPGDSVGVAVVIDSGENIGAVSFQLRYDKNVLRFAPPAERGEFLAQGGAPADVQAIEGGEGGSVVVSAVRGGASGAGGTGRLVRLNFVALKAGQAAFGFASSQVRGADGDSLPASFRVAQLEVKKP